MLLEEKLRNKKIVLASGSTERQNMLRSIGIEAELVPSEFPEDLDFANFPNFSDFVEETALQKIEEVYARMLQAQKAGDNIQMPDVMIAADTMVTLEGEMYGKPQDEQHAIEMLTKLSGKKNTVYTGVVIKYNGNNHKFTVSTDVFFHPLSRERIEHYVSTGEPLTRAGAYAIQGRAKGFIEGNNGCYHNVCGLPLTALYNKLDKIIHE